MCKRLFFIILVSALCLGCSSNGNDDELLLEADGVGYAVSIQGIPETFDALDQAFLAAEPISVVARLDHTANAADAGLQLRPTRVIMFGNPNLGTPLMMQNQTAGLDLPQKVLVYEDADGLVFAAYNTTDYLAARHGLAGVETLPQIATALSNFVTNATGGMVEQVPARGIARGQGIVSVESALGVDSTYAQLKTAIESNPALTIVAELDHAQNAASVGMTLRPTHLLVFGNPSLGTPLMQSAQTIGLDLPQKMLVWEAADGTVYVSYNDPSYLADRHGITDRDTELETIADALANLAGAATTQ